jgi:transcriptional regulator
MYISTIYQNHDQAEIKAFIAANSFGLLINTVAGRPYATHIPLLLTTNAAGEEVLAGHISKANSQWKTFVEPSEVLVVFSGPHTYISSSWYDHANVPTWNYIAIHIYGSLQIVDETTLRNDLRSLVNKHEAASAKPVVMGSDDLPEKMVTREMRGIIGFHIKINEIQAAYKLSQNRDDHNHTNIISELHKTGDAQAAAVADAMIVGR